MKKKYDWLSIFTIIISIVAIGISGFNLLIYWNLQKTSNQLQTENNQLQNQVNKLVEAGLVHDRAVESLNFLKSMGNSPSCPNETRKEIVKSYNKALGAYIEEDYDLTMDIIKETELGNCVEAGSETFEEAARGKEDIESVNFVYGWILILLILICLIVLLIILRSRK